MKQVIVCLLAIFYLLAGCSVQQPEVTDKPQETVADIFTQPSEATTQAATEASTEPSEIQWPTTPGLPNRDFPKYSEGGFESQSYTYTGGEMHLNYILSAGGYSNIGMGIRLFVDGQPQPYKTAEDDTLSYMHTFYPEDSVVYTHEFIFTPVAGEVGQPVEIYVVRVNDPEFFLGDGNAALRHTDMGYYGGRTLLTLEEAPEEQILPELPNRLLSWNCSYRDATDAEISEWTAEDFEQKIGMRFFVNTADELGMRNGIYNTTAEDTVNIRYEVWGTPHVHFCFVIFMDNQPVSVLPEDRIDVEIKSGQMTVIEAELSLEGFDGSSVVNAVLVPRDFFKNGITTIADLEATKAAYLSSAASYEELLNQ